MERDGERWREREREGEKRERSNPQNQSQLTSNVVPPTDYRPYDIDVSKNGGENSKSVRRGQNADRLERLSLSTLLITYLSAFYFLGELQSAVIRGFIAFLVIVLNVFFIGYFLYEYIYDKAEDLELGKRMRNSSVFRAFAKTIGGSARASGSRPASLNFDSPRKKRSQLGKQFNPTHSRQPSSKDSDTAARLSYARAKGSPKRGRQASRAGGHGRQSSTGLLALGNGGSKKGHASKPSTQLRELELGTISEKKVSAGDVTLPPGWERHVDKSGKPYYVNRASGKSQWEKPALDERSRGKTFSKVHSLEEEVRLRLVLCLSCRLRLPPPQPPPSPPPHPP